MLQHCSACECTAIAGDLERCPQCGALLGDPGLVMPTPAPSATSQTPPARSGSATAKTPKDVAE